MKKAIFILFLVSFSSPALLAQKEIVRTELAPEPVGPYSQAVVANGMLFVAGQLGIDPVTRKLVEGGVEKEVVRIMENIRAILAARGLNLTHVVNTTIFMKDLSQFAKVNQLYSTYFTEEFPARTTVGVADLPAGAAIEIAVVAAVPIRKRKK
jgi:2-iminobutanoate/2-iminopropanoate deaminase